MSFQEVKDIIAEQGFGNNITNNFMYKKEFTNFKEIIKFSQNLRLEEATSRGTVTWLLLLNVELGQ